MLCKYIADFLVFPVESVVLSGTFRIGGVGLAKAADHFFLGLTDSVIDSGGDSGKHPGPQGHRLL